jgi:hypothetical protein
LQDFNKLSYKAKLRKFKKNIIFRIKFTIFYADLVPYQYKKTRKTDSETFIVEKFSSLTSKNLFFDSKYDFEPPYL